MVSKKVVLMEKNGKDIMKFNINSNTIDEIDLNSTDQTNLRNLFYKIINQVLIEDFEFLLEIEQNYKKNLYIEIATEYIKQLNVELGKIKDEIPTQLK